MSNSNSSNWGGYFLIAGIVLFFIVPPLGFILVLFGLYLMGQDKPTNNITPPSYKYSTNRTYRDYYNNSAKPNQSVLDITSINTPNLYDHDQWKGVKTRLNLSQDQILWLNKLSIPYKRSILSSAQCENEVIKLFLDLVAEVDRYMINNKGMNLRQLVAILNSRGGYYDNILYTLECIAEFEVGNFYKKYGMYDLKYSFELLEKNTSQSLTDYLKNYLLERVKLIEPADAQTLKLIKPASQSLLNQKKIGDLMRDDKSFEGIPIRFNRFLENIQTQEESAKIYKKLINIIKINYKTTNLVQRNKEFLEMLFNERRKDYRNYFKKVDQLTSNLHKISEDIVRKAYNVNSLPSIDESYVQLKKLFKKQLSELIKVEAINSISTVAPPSSKTLADLKGKISYKVVEPVVRKEIKIDSSKVNQIITANDNTIIELNKFLVDEDIIEAPINDTELTTLADVFEDNEVDKIIQFNEIEIEFLKVFASNNFLVSGQDADIFIKTKNLFKSSFIDGINQKFYTSYEDSLILETENGYKIDEYHVNILLTLLPN